MSDAVIASLSAALEAVPHDVALRLHLVDLLARAGRHEEALTQCARALETDPTSTEARRRLDELLTRPPSPATGPTSGRPADPAVADRPAGTTPEQPADDDTATSEEAGTDFDWGRAEADLGAAIPPMFVRGEEPGPAPTDVERPGPRLPRLDDVAGMGEVKARIEAAFLAPLRNPELGRLYGTSMRGGLLLYGPPGCGKTFLARAVAGELGASFVDVSISDVLGMYLGTSETNLHDLFERARRNRPCVLFLDEVDALGQRRALVRGGGMRTLVNQLLQELDGVSSDNDGLFVLAATNQPWDVDEALRRPGRLDRTLFVAPPDEAAREALFEHHLRSRPVERIDLGRLARRTDGLTGADIAHLCSSAAEQALLEASRSGTTRMIQMADLERAARAVRPSIGAWLASARNVVEYANGSGEYDDLADYLQTRDR